MKRAASPSPSSSDEDDDPAMRAGRRVVKEAHAAQIIADDAVFEERLAQFERDVWPTLKIAHWCHVTDLPPMSFMVQMHFFATATAVVFANGQLEPHRIPSSAYHLLGLYTGTHHDPAIISAPRAATYFRARKAQREAWLMDATEAECPMPLRLHLQWDRQSRALNALWKKCKEEIVPRAWAPVIKDMFRQLYDDFQKSYTAAGMLQDPSGMNHAMVSLCGGANE